MSNCPPQWVTDSAAWPTPADCKAMTSEEAERLIRVNADNAVHAQLLIDYQTARRDRFTDVAKRIAAVHPDAARRVRNR